MELKICHLYPDVLNLYGDRGNIICMKKRLEWRGIEVSVRRSGIGDGLDLSDCDLVFIGGGQDFEQEILLDDLHKGKDKSLLSAIDDGLPVLAICGGYQMLGSYYETHDGKRCDFIGAIDLHTIGSQQRMIGNCLFTLDAVPGCTIVGFENHSGKTYLAQGVQPLGHTVSGFGNNGEDKTEGVHWKNVFGTYSHGPLLPKNPVLCDLILRTTLDRKYGSCTLGPLDDRAEHRAHDSMADRLGKGGNK